MSPFTYSLRAATCILSGVNSSIVFKSCIAFLNFNCYFLKDIVLFYKSDFFSVSITNDVYPPWELHYKQLKLSQFGLKFPSEQLLNSSNYKESILVIFRLHISECISGTNPKKFENYDRRINWMPIKWIKNIHLA